MAKSQRFIPALIEKILAAAICLSVIADHALRGAAHNFVAAVTNNSQGRELLHWQRITASTPKHQPQHKTQHQKSAKQTGNEQEEGFHRVQ
ncbi:MAG: hypothetical protein ACSHXK_08395 [Oceanococcus sp.]